MTLRIVAKEHTRKSLNKSVCFKSVIQSPLLCIVRIPPFWITFDKADRVRVLNKPFAFSLSALPLGKSMSPTITPPVMGK